MSKAPQSITAPPSAPRPAPCPGLPQAAFPPGQPPSVFSTPPAQMNTAPQSQQQYYPGRPGSAHGPAPQQPGSAPRPVAQTHVYQPGTPMMMISQQQLPFANSQSTAYFIPPGQYRPTYIAPAQQYPVSGGNPGFYPGTSQAEYEPPLTVRGRGSRGRGRGQENNRHGLHGAPLNAKRFPAGTYYPAQPQYAPSVPAAPLIVSPPQPQPTPVPLPQPQPQAQAQSKRERKQIRIRDPNQGGRDITEEIMLGGRSTSTPTPPQSGVSGPEESSSVQTNGESEPLTVTTETPDAGEDSTALPAVAPAAEPQTPPLSRSPKPAPTAPPADKEDPDEGVVVSTQVEEPVPPEETINDNSTASPTTNSPGDSADARPPSPSTNLNPDPAPVTSTDTDQQPADTETTTEQPPAQEMEEGLSKESKQVPEKAQEEKTSPPLDSTPASAPTEPPSKAANEPSVDLPPVCEPETLPESPSPVLSQEPQLPNGLDPPVIMETPNSTVVTALPLPTDEQEETPPDENSTPSGREGPEQAAVSKPKEEMKKMDLNLNGEEEKGDVQDSSKEPPQMQVVESAPESEQVQSDKLEAHPAPPMEVPVEDKKQQHTQSLKPEAVKAGDLKYQYKGEQWKPIDPEEKKRYDREFLLGFQFVGVSMHKPEGLPPISDVVLDKANKTPLRPLDPSRLTAMNSGPDFTPSFANLGRPSTGGRGPPSGMGGPRRSQQGQQRKEPRKIIARVSLNEDVQLNKAEKAWKPSVKQQSSGRGDEEGEEDAESARTQELFRRVRSILNKLTPQMFQSLMRQVTELTIDTEERLKGVIDLVFEKAISEPNFSVAYANMCRCLMGLKVPTTDKPTITVNFRKLLLNRCQREFEKDKDDDEIFEKKQKEMEAAATEEERQLLREALEEARDKARRRSLGNIKFIGELFKLKMLTEAIMHDCVVKLLKNHDEESLECLCRLLTTIGKDLDFQKAKPRMDQYFTQIEKIIKERKTSSRIRFMLQDVLDLRKNNWVPRRGDQGPKTIDQIHKEAELEQHREQVKVQQQLLSKKDTPRGGAGGGIRGGRGGPSQDEGWNTVPISTKNRPIDTSRLSKITKPGALDFNNQLLAPGGKGMWGSWGKGSSGGSGSKSSGEAASETGRPATSTLNRFSALQHTSSSSTLSRSAEADRRAPHRGSSSRDRLERGGHSDRGSRMERREDKGVDREHLSASKRSYSREAEPRGPADTHRRVSSMSHDRGSRDRGSRERGSRDRGNRRETAEKVQCQPALVTLTPPTLGKPAMNEDELEKKSKAIIEEYLHINDMKEALQCVQEMNAEQLLFLFVRNGIESTLERSTIAREHMGLLLRQLVKAGTLPSQQYYKGLQEILEVAEDMAIDIPHIWVYLAEIITPMLHEGVIPMGQLFREVSKPLLPLGKAAVLLVEILFLLCKGMSHKKAGTLWREAGLSWRDFLSEDEDVNKFVTEKKVEFTLGDDSEKASKKEMSSEELRQHLDKLIEQKADNQRIYDWVEANLDEQQASSNLLVRALMTSVCQSAIIGENPYKVDTEQLARRARVLQKYLTDEQKELQALYALQALMVKMEQPANLLRMFFDTLYDEDVIKEEAFYKWESSKDPAEQQGKGVALKSVTAFFTWLREAEEESDNN
ncbi:hypothetical protein JZ751_014248 [Albula glossodonta]|uniref:Eukaryotic translation initiation factor 4 gamma 1-like n=1 Tax=Albula glossodonta TaxID=121402 RepID=A0A8T2P3Q1_9TELE|nr:hypothetical protein JZ751_014248 [Albula glossodonta]